MACDPEEARQELRQVLARSRLMTEAGAALASSLEGEEGLRRLAHLVVPQLGDACVVDIREDDRVRRVAVTHAMASRRAAATFSETAFPLPELSSSILGRVLRGAGPQLVHDVSPVTEPVGEQRRLYRELGAGQVLVVPLQARRQVLGALSFLRPAAGPLFDEGERALAAELGHRAALTLDNTRLYRLQRRTAEELQRSLLPDLGGGGPWQLTARYVPARERAEVGGDWYDAFRLRDGSTTLAIGDVIGHDLTAAVRMSELRNMLRALAYDSDDTPAAVMSRLDRVMQGLTDIELVTAVVGRIRELPGRGCEMRWANAGHPPPLLVPRDGEARLLEHDPDPVLGTDLRIPRVDRVDVLPPGSTLLLYTDGLIERPGEDIGRGFVRLRQQADALAREPLETFFDELLARMLSDYQDDVALLALRVPLM
ncbi:PP2C family protein-serine/threonine phosphatase [Streptomyces sp. NPDC051569]|uniref:PP2C family protein-serine/threonine phosphatase n=1 Tax=Streptomyces sp. NPDC051569 TaxID=3365661 RepID=UPI00378868F8